MNDGGGGLLNGCGGARSQKIFPGEASEEEDEIPKNDGDGKHLSNYQLLLLFVDVD